MVYLLDIVVFHILNDPTVLMAIDGYWLVVGIAGWTGSPTMKKLMTLEMKNYNYSSYSTFHVMVMTTLQRTI